MKCFRHSASEAVAICRQCGRAVCELCTLDSADPVVLCSPECQSEAQKDALVKEIIAQNALVSFRSLKGAAVVLKLLGVTMLIGAAGELIGTFLLADQIPWFRADDPISAISTAGLFALTAICLFIGVRQLIPITRKHERLFAKFGQEGAEDA